MDEGTRGPRLHVTHSPPFLNWNFVFRINSSQKSELQGSSFHVIPVCDLLIFDWHCRRALRQLPPQRIVPARYHPRGPYTCSPMRAHTRLTVPKSRVSRWITTQRCDATRRNATRRDTTCGKFPEREARSAVPAAFRGHGSRLSVTPMTTTATTTTLSGWSWRRHEAVALYDCETGCNGTIGEGEGETRGFREKRAKRAGTWVRAASLCATLSYVSLRARRFQSIAHASRSNRMYAICIVNWAWWCNFRFVTEYLLVSLSPSDIFIADAVNILKNGFLVGLLFL